MPVSRNYPSRNKKKPVACYRCHSHKVKCSGEKPCARCRQAGCGDECQYALRDRKLKVNESYLDQLIRENARLKEHLRNATPHHTPAGVPESADTQESCSPLQNPLLGDRAWFYPYDPSAPPIFMGELACTAFATRLRQFLTSNPNTAHIPRTQYTPETLLVDDQTSWPGAAQARLLIRVAFHQLSRVYHLLLRKSTLDQLDAVYRTPCLRDDPALTCKFFALFALGEAYSCRSDQSRPGRIPGTRYYVRAMNLTTIMPERPSMIHVEALLLLSLFSYFLNRRHSAYTLIGNTMRLGLILGLNHNIPARQCTDPIEREHRVRLWWAIYILDRMYTSKIGFPLQIRDDDIHVDMPSDLSCPGAEDQFSDTAYLLSSVRLSRITGQIIEKIYSRQRHRDTFLQRQQQLLLSLQSWLHSLPAHIKLLRNETPEKHVVSLHLQFNQCVILTTRPVLLHALFQLRGPNKGHEELPQPVITLSEACIHASRHSHALIVDEWVNGSVPMYGYFYAQYLFSSAVILVISGILPSIGLYTDMESLETTIAILQRMSEHGNLAAMEFYENLKRLKQCLPEESLAFDADQNRVASSQTKPHAPSISTNQPTLENHNGNNSHTVGFTTEMAFLEPTMQDFLTGSDDMGLVDPGIFSMEDPSEIDVWPSTLWTL
ncbi:fungal-specific transcription factor [Aspergillus ambiguus]|uniref:Zn(II)2Cys6 transcription factor n=1 Tax=Aspergillus ambiguus TaxID=176160 RepID=UPI003CCDAF3E